jgi:hypothetical protein
MRITTFSPTAQDDQPSVTVDGDFITISGIAYEQERSSTGMYGPLIPVAILIEANCK